jgi:hypothetical protein
MAEEVLNDVDKAILILNIQNIDDLSVISAPITEAATRTRTRLLITIFSTFFDDAAGSSWDAVQKLLTHAYVQATTVSQKYNKILMSVDVLLRGLRSPAEDEPIINEWNIVFSSGTSPPLCLSNRTGVILFSRASRKCSRLQSVAIAACCTSSGSSGTVYGSIDILRQDYKLHYLSGCCHWRNI